MLVAETMEHGIWACSYFDLEHLLHSPLEKSIIEK